jgi:hypothetical protein
MIILLVAPVWIVYDLTRQNDSLYRFYNRTELFFKRTWIAIPAILLVLLNWVWNIVKGL